MINLLLRESVSHLRETKEAFCKATLVVTPLSPLTGHLPLRGRLF